MCQIKTFIGILTNFILCLVVSSAIKAQGKYFIVRENSDKYGVKVYDLHTDNLYRTHKRVQLFNLFPASALISEEKPYYKQEEDLILFSVLPDINETMDWKEIAFKELENDTLSYSELSRLKEKSLIQQFDLMYNENNKYFNKYRLVIQKKEKYYVAKNTLLQFFAIRNRPEPFNNVFGTINTDLTLISILEFEQIYKQVYPSTEFPLYTLRSPVYSSSFDRLRDRREYLSKKHINQNKDTLYQFWTYTDWHTHTHDLEIDRGIDRFVYVPEKGIVGGSFDFYFYFHRKSLGLTIADFIKNIQDEKVMLTKEYQ